MPGELKTKAVSITVTKTQRAKVDMMAELDDRSMAGMLRIIIEEAFKKRGLKLKANRKASDE